MMAFIYGLVDLRTLFLKSRITEEEAPTTQPVAPAPTLIQTTTASEPATETTGEEEDLNAMHQKLVESFMVPRTVSGTAMQYTIAQPPAVWVSKWVDYSNKYGLGYQLSNNIFGAYFNDSTKMAIGGNTR